MRSIKFLGVLLIVAFFIVPAVTVVASMPSDGAEKSNFYYDQLNANSKAIYDAAESAGADVRTLTIQLPMKITVTSDKLDEAKNYLETIVRTTSDAAFGALRIASPMAYWGWVASVVKQPTYTLEQRGNSLTVSSLTYTNNVGNFPINAETGEPDIEKALSDLREAVDRFHTDSTTTRDKVRDINNYITNIAVYDPNYGITEAKDGGEKESAFCHDAYGALVDPKHYAVCDGYSKAFLLLCEKEGIECIMVYGTALTTYVNHAWNYVKMDNGKWYAIDVTWNDNGKDDNPYFLKGGLTFFTTHSQGEFLSFGMKSYQFNGPILSTTDFDESGESSDIRIYGWVAAAAIVAVLCVVIIIHNMKNKR